MIRRTFQLPADNNLGVPGQVLVTYNELTGEVHCATRQNTWDTWSVPMLQIDAQDDAPGAARVYQHVVESAPEVPFDQDTASAPE